MPDPVLSVFELTRSYKSGNRQLTVLRDVSFTVPHGQTCAIIGPSGSGKTTLLGLCAGLDHPSSGAVTLLGRELAAMNEDQLALLRAHEVGFVFQSFRLLPTLTALENVMVPLELLSDKGAEAAARDLLSRVGLGDRTDHYPTQLSGGEQQRVAIARAFVHQPRILFADEPTGELDGETGRAVIDILFELNREAGTTLILVTHDQDLAARCERVFSLKDGAIVKDESASPVTAGRKDSASTT